MQKLSNVNASDLLLDMTNPLRKTTNIKQFFNNFKIVMKKFKINGISSVQFHEETDNDIFIKNTINNRYYCPLVKAGSIALNRRFHYPQLFGLHPDYIRRNKDDTGYIITILAPNLGTKIINLKTLENIMRHHISGQQFTNIINRSIKNQL